MDATQPRARKPLHLNSQRLMIGVMLIGVVACGGETVLQQQDRSLVEDLTETGGGVADSSGETQPPLSDAHASVDFNGETHQFDDALYCDIDLTDPVPVRATFGDEMFQDPVVDALVVAAAGQADTDIKVNLGTFTWQGFKPDPPQITNGIATWESLVLREVNGQAEDATMTITIRCG